MRNISKSALIFQSGGFILLTLPNKHEAAKMRELIRNRKHELKRNYKLGLKLVVRTAQNFGPVLHILPHIIRDKGE